MADYDKSYKPITKDSIVGQPIEIIPGKFNKAFLKLQL
jgi:hypothetical protein